MKESGRGEDENERSGSEAGKEGERRGEVGQSSGERGWSGQREMKKVRERTEGGRRCDGRR